MQEETGSRSGKKFQDPERTFAVGKKIKEHFRHMFNIHYVT
jgi:hypothetical protein